MLIADTGNNRIRVDASSTGTFYGVAMTKGDIYTIAGGGSVLGDGGPATSADISEPEAVGVDTVQGMCSLPIPVTTGSEW